MRSEPAIQTAAVQFVAAENFYCFCATTELVSRSPSVAIENMSIAYAVAELAVSFPATVEDISFEAVDDAQGQKGMEGQVQGSPLSPPVQRSTPVQTLKGGGVVVLHETIHELHTKKLDGFLFKIDFEKAYDKVKWSFLQQDLRMKGFLPEMV